MEQFRTNPIDQPNRPGYFQRFRITFIDYEYTQAVSVFYSTMDVNVLENDFLIESLFQSFAEYIFDSSEVFHITPP